MREDEGPSQSDIEKFGGDSRPCPHCGASIYDDSEWCHKCGKVLGGSDEGRGPRPWVLAVIVVVVLVTMFVVAR